MSTALQEEIRRAALVLGLRVYDISPKAFAKLPDTRGRAVA